MTTPDINILKNDKTHTYISWNFMYFSPPPTVNYINGKYTLPHNEIKMVFNSLTYYPAISKITKIKLSSLDSELGIRSDHFKDIYKDKKINKELFLNLRDIANSIPNIGLKITKGDKDNTPHFIIPINKFNNVYSIVVIYTNNDKIPKILGNTNHNVVTLMCNIDVGKRRINLFNNVSEKLCLDQKQKIQLAYLTLDYETLFYLCTKYMPCLDLIPKS